MTPLPQLSPTAGAAASRQVYPKQLVAAHHRRAALRPASCRAVAVAGLWRPPAEIAARAGHSVRVLLTIYAHGIPGCDQIASQHIDRALRPSRWPPAGPQKTGRRQESRPPYVRATADATGHSWT